MSLPKTENERKGENMRIDKTVRLGTVDSYKGQIDVFCRIRFEAGRLSISGVEGPLRNGNARGSCGQIEMSLGDGSGIAPAPGWSRKLTRKFLKTWRAWHLNDMRAGCEHQRAEGVGSRSLTVKTYWINSTAWKLKRAAEAEKVTAAQEGRAANLTPAQVFLVGKEWFLDRHTLPGSESPLAGLYELKKEEKKLSGWVYESEHAEGELMKKCPVCGYAYGSSWLKEDVPADVLEFLESLPDTDKTPAWC